MNARAFDADLAPQDRLEALRSRGAARLDPLRFHALEALARRIAQQAPAVQALLQPKLEQGLAEYAQRVAADPRFAAGPRPIAVRPRPAPTPLAQLNAALCEAGGEDARELASAQRFRQSWERGRTLDRVDEAVARKPANAGPLNSHMLVLQSLALMRELSPDYLRRFVRYAETLLWLQDAAALLPRDAARGGKPAKATRRSARARK